MHCKYRIWCSLSGDGYIYLLHLQFHSLINSERLHTDKLKLSLFATLAVDCGDCFKSLSMSSLRNAISRRAHKERAQPESRKKFGLLEKHKDYVERAKAYHKKEETLRRLKEKAAFRNPDEFYFKMIKTRTVDGVHKLENQANKYTPEELLLMKTQDIGYIIQKVQSEKKKIEKLTATLHFLDNRPSSRHVYFAEDRE
ncbi:unnamed protein product [Prunus armeniaca]